MIEYKLVNFAFIYQKTPFLLSISTVLYPQVKNIILTILCQWLTLEMPKKK